MGRGYSIEDVLARTDLAALLDEVTTRGPTFGRQARWHCPRPQHDDEHASVTVRTDARGHERWRCWSGDDTHRGDAVDLVRLVQGVDRTAALERRAARAGFVEGVPTIAAPERRRVAAPAAEVMHPSVLRYVEACERILWTRTGREVRDWLHGRGFDDELLRANRVGCDPGRAMLARRRGLPSGRGAAATFPALDSSGEVAYVQARVLGPRGGPKHEYPSSALEPNPRLAWVRSAGALVDDRLVVCEGIPDAFTARSAGLRSVALLGVGAVSANVADRLAEVAPSGIVIATNADADDAGAHASAQMAQLLEQRGCLARVVSPAVARDLNSWALIDSGWSRSLLDPSLVT